MIIFFLHYIWYLQGNRDENSFVDGAKARDEAQRLYHAG